METRLRILGIACALFSLALLVRLFFWQVLKGKELSSQARYQYQQGEQILAQRGSILAADGTWLAVSQEAWLVFASKPELTESPRTIANQLAPLLVEEERLVPDLFDFAEPSESEEATEEGEVDLVETSLTDQERLLQETVRLEEFLSRKDVVWVPLKHRVDAETKQNIEALGIAGIGFEREEKRYYPEASIAAQALGFVGKDDQGNDQGYFGLEGFYDLMLSGKPGYLQRESDAQGSPILFGQSKEIGAVAGVDLVTHLDKTIQLITERKLKEGIERYGAKSGSVVVMNPQTGAILAMASFPSFDPDQYQLYGNEYFKNPIISDTFEPGSIFKPLIMAAALDADLVKPETKCEICDGPVKVDKYEIETWNKEYYPDSTMTEVIIHSDNVGMVFVGEKLGADQMYDYLEKCGFGQLTDIDLQGESPSILREKGTWNVVDLAVTAFGQSIAVTPIQMIKAMAIIANDGVLVNPQVVDKIKIDGFEEEIKSETGKQVFSKKVADQVTEMMVLAVKEGESKWTVAKGFKVAGKTGTAQIPVKGHYDEEKTIGSFIGFAPADNPKFIMLVTLREPQTSPWASETAAPLWFSIANELFPYLGIQPES